MADFSNIKLEVKSEKFGLSLEKFVYEVAIDDLATALNWIAADEISSQIGIGNNPTRILVDGRSVTVKAFGSAQKRVQAFFANTDDLYNALVMAWDEVRRITPVLTGRAVSSYQIWFNNTVIGTNPLAAKSFLPNFNPVKDQFRVVGPVLVYGRKVYYNPRGTLKFRKRTVFKNKEVIIKKVRLRGIMDLAAKKVQARFKSIQVSESWVVTGALPRDGRTPAIVISFRRKGFFLR